MSFSSSTTRRDAPACPDDDAVRVSYRFGAGFEIREGTGAPQLVSLKELLAIVHRVESAAQAAEQEGDTQVAGCQRAVAVRLRRDAHWQCAIARQFEVNLARRAGNGESEEA